MSHATRESKPTNPSRVFGVHLLASWSSCASTRTTPRALNSCGVNRYSPDGEHAYCPKCERERVFKRYETAQQRQSWTCTGCGHHLHPTAGTIFHKSSTSLHLWFYAMYLMTSTRCGISAKQLERELGVTYKTAWRMAHLIRNELMTQDDEPLSGAVEADETYIGGQRRGMATRSTRSDRTRRPCSASSSARGASWP